MSDSRADERNVVRLIALSDGIFAIAMTLLVLDIHVTPDLDGPHFQDMVEDLLPHIGAYALSFAILAGFWRDHRRILQLAQRVEGLSLRLSLAGLGAIALLPFPTTLLSEYASQTLSVVIYAATVIVIDLLQIAVLRTIHYQPRAAGSGPEPAHRNLITDLVSNVVVFGAALLIAFASPRGALWTLVLLVPLRFVLAHRARKRA
ncbi:hypothetical protein HY68_08495 [Streptomyces sp. AcH 505]|uniref:TMEM175 family protein n=1 Tax=unclassified Streptomyces TaxID=2593676 RepID=UPI000591A40B|nr:TMEM175 family protein [Streptomyces sp. NBC_00370]KIF68666.1 hypothetical protein HY68_08495 [Streptomyces sp. AcH 505]